MIEFSFVSLLWYFLKSQTACPNYKSCISHKQNDFRETESLIFKDSNYKVKRMRQYPESKQASFKYDENPIGYFLTLK